jgi:hypothetical protein
VLPEGLGKFKNSPRRVFNRDLPVCSIAPYSTASTNINYTSILVAKSDYYFCRLTSKRTDSYLDLSAEMRKYLVVRNGIGRIVLLHHLINQSGLNRSGRHDMSLTYSFAAVRIRRRDTTFW